MKTFVTLAVVVILLSGCDPKQAPVNQPAVKTALVDLLPKKMLVRIGGWDGASYKVELKGEKLIYWHNPNTFLAKDSGWMTEEISPTQEGWKVFRKSLDAADVGAWDDEYVDKGIYDGTQWAIDIEYTDKKYHSYGSNDYPDQDEFNQMLKAVSDLVEGRDFK